ncbi:MAG: AAA family ATPase [Acidimicrobiia bacterium]|nr:AAA family ATPase [Acidimicrobiia bacterium]
MVAVRPQSFGVSDSVIVAIANQKGGVGKSTTAISLAATLAQSGLSVLVVDLDPQGNATSGLGIDRAALSETMYDVLVVGTKADDAMVESSTPGLWVLPATIDLAGAEVELVSMLSRELRLKNSLNQSSRHFDAILIDSPPSLGLLTINGMAAADEILVPIQAEYYALEGLTQLMANIERVRAHLNPDLEVEGVVLTMHDNRTRLAKDVGDQVREYFGDRTYRTIVPRSVRLSEAPSYGEPIETYDPMSQGAIAYRELGREWRRRHGYDQR